MREDGEANVVEQILLSKHGEGLYDIICKDGSRFDGCKITMHVERTPEFIKVKADIHVRIVWERSIQ